MNQVDRVLRILFREIPLGNELSDFDKLREKPLSLGRKDFREQVCKRYLQIYQSNYSFDEVAALIEGLRQEIVEAYVGLKENQVSPLYLFPLYAKKLFTLEDSQLFVKFEHILEWDGFHTKVDPIIFQAAYLAQEPGDIQCNPLIRHTEKRLYKLLSQGAYETHMHMNGSGYSWEINWHNLACSMPIKYLKSWKKGELKNLDCMEVYRVQTLRTYFLSVVMYGSDNDKFPIKTLQKILACNTERQYLAHREMLRQIHYQFERFAPAFSHKIQGAFLKERFFLKGLFALMEKQMISALEESLLTIYLGLMCQFRLRFVQDNNGMGFDKFQRCEEIKSCFFEEKDEDRLVQSVLEKYYAEGFVEGIELRMAPKSVVDLRRKIARISCIHQQVYDGYLVSNPYREKMKLGIIIHYIKSKEHYVEGECRHALLRRRINNQAQWLLRYFEGQKTGKNQPEIPIVGVDAANAEIHCSPEIFAPIFREHRKEIATKQSLGFTYHVGEDFINLSSGLRAIDDVLGFFNFTRGDRFGHAIALGIHVETYLKYKRNYVVGTLQTMVDDYAWLYDIIASQSGKGTPDLLVRLEREYQKHCKKLFTQVDIPIPSIETYRDSYLLRGDDPDYFQRHLANGKQAFPRSAKLNYENSAHEAAISSQQACDLYLCYHYHGRYRENSQLFTKIEADATYIESVTLAQEILRNKVYHLGVSIECNPTSNKRISYISTYDALPLLAFYNGPLVKTTS